MKRLLVVAGLTTLLAAPAGAQFLGMPVWNSPKGGTGIIINGDYAMPDDAHGGGSSFGGRASIGFSALTLYGGLGSWTPDGAGDATTSFGGGAAFRVIGGSLIPVAVNVLAGAAATSGDVSFTSIVAGAGISASLPIPGFSLEPYINVTNRWWVDEDDTGTGFGATFGANLTMGLFGVHLAYDTFSIDDVSMSVFGLGAHFSIKSPV